MKHSNNKTDTALILLAGSERAAAEADVDASLLAGERIVTVDRVLTWIDVEQDILAGAQ